MKVKKKEKQSKRSMKLSKKSESSPFSKLVESESDKASTSSSTNGSSSSCEEIERLKNPRSNPNYLKATTSSEKKKMNLLVSDLTDYESSSVSFDDKKSVSLNTKSKFSPNFKRNTSLRTLRILMSKPKKGICDKVSEGESVIRATCSSALKDSRVPIVEVEPEERDTEKVSALRVCTYTYCSLHGKHSHSSAPPLKRILSKKRRFSNTQKGVKSNAGGSVKDIKTKKMVVEKVLKGRKKGKSSKGVSSIGKVKGAKGDEDKNGELSSESIEYDDLAKNNRPGVGKKKQMSMWYLIHQQMVSGLAEGLDNQEMETQKTGMKNKDIEDTETRRQDLETQKVYATKLVRDAIEKILLPEVPDQPPDDLSICRDAPSDQELLQKQKPSEDPQHAKKIAPKSWSNLKKLILLKRFVKELEKVRKINPKKPTILSLGSDKEGKKVSLRRNGLDKKKSAEEWMLDYALQQAVSELAPTQKRKVELLIKAFENVVPSFDGEQSPLSFVKLKSIRNEGDHGDESNVLVEGKSNEGNECNSSMQSQDVDDVINDQNEDDNKESPVANNNDSSFSDSGWLKQFTKAEDVLVSKDLENYDIDSLETVVSLNEREFPLNESTSEQLEIDKAPPTIDSQTENDPLREFKAKFTKPKNMSMWHLIHQQMVAGLDDENKTENKPESEEDSFNSNLISECDEIEPQEIELRKVFAIKMVREAIEKILLPEVQDDQSTTSETASEQDFIDKKQEEDWGSQIFNSIGSAKEDFTHYSNNKVIYDMSLTQEGTQKSKLEMEKDEAKIVLRAEKQAPKRWSNLKKWILLQRFVKALEKVKDFNPKRPNLLPLKIDHESEKIRLRNQMMNGKRNAEEWMLDYALRKVVSELAPKQKKKVELLVKAFETVIPPTEEMKSPVIIPNFKSTGSVKKLKNAFTEKIDDGNEDSAKAVEKSDAVSPSPSPFKDTKLNGLGCNSFDNSIASRESDTRILGFSSTGKLANTQFNKQKHMKMWHLLCQHVVSDIAVKVEDENPNVDQNKGNGNPSLEFSKSDAVKLVKDAIDEILVPDIQDDSSDTVSIGSDVSLDQDLLEEKKPRNWDKLKKLILMKRSIKALEKARRLEPRAPRHLLLDPGREDEKIDLKRRLLGERKKAEEWMLDYAVQHAVTKLTPDRKRRVSMLVEAFEAVVPLPQI